VIIGYMLERYKFPLVPVVIGLVLGQLFDNSEKIKKDGYEPDESQVTKMMKFLCDSLQ